METDEDLKMAPSFVSPVALQLNRLIQQTQSNNTEVAKSLFQLPPGVVSGINTATGGLTTQPLGSVAVPGHPTLQTIAGHDKMIMSSATPQVTTFLQILGGNTVHQLNSPTGNTSPLLMVSNNGSNGIKNAASIGNIVSSSVNQSQPMIVILPPNNTSVQNNLPTPPPQQNPNSQVESLLKSVLGNTNYNG